MRCRVLDESGRPVQGVAFEFGLNAYSTAYGNWAAARPDADGRFVFEHVNRNVPGTYDIEFRSRFDYVPVSMPVTPGPREYIIRLQRGLELTGTLVDAATNEPVPNVELRAAAEGPDAAWRLYEARFPTDAEGRFRFSNLAPGAYKLHVGTAGTLPEASFAAGTGTPIVLRLQR